MSTPCDDSTNTKPAAPALSIGGADGSMDFTLDLTPSMGSGSEGNQTTNESIATTSTNNTNTTTTTTSTTTTSTSTGTGTGTGTGMDLLLDALQETSISGGVGTDTSDLARSMGTNTQTWNVRRYEPQDEKAVHGIFTDAIMRSIHDARLDGSKEITGPFVQAVQSFVRESLADDLADIQREYMWNMSSNFWVATLEGRVLGIIAVQKNPEDPKVAMLRRFGVHTDARGQGLGSRLIETLLAFCRDCGYQRVRLTAADYLGPAQHVYRKFGFKSVDDNGVMEEHGQFAIVTYEKTLQHPTR